MAGKVLVYMGALNLTPQIHRSQNVHVYATFHLNAPNHANVWRKNSKILKFLHMCFTSVNNVAAGESSKEICNLWCMCGALLSDHYYDCPGTIG